MAIFIVFYMFALAIVGINSQTFGDMEIVAEWIEIDFDWDSEEQRNASLTDGSFIPENNVASGIKVYNDDIFVTVPRWLPGVPSTMNTLVFQDGVPLLKPWPNWEMQKIGDCSALQYTQSMEIVSDTNEMWVIDVGRINIWEDDPINDCPPKLLIFDLTTQQVIHRHIFPNAVLSYQANFVNDIVVDPEGNYAYMSDTGVSAVGYNGGIIFFDRTRNLSRRLQHSTMDWEANRPDGGYDMEVNGTIYDFPFPSNGIALSTDRSSLFYCPLGGVQLTQVRTDSLQACEQEVCNLTDTLVKSMGEKVSESDGMAWGHQLLYFAALGENAIYTWNHKGQMEDQGVNDLWDVEMTEQVLLKQDNVSLIWGDTFAFDSDGWLYITADRIAMFANGEIDYSGDEGPNFRIVRIFVDDKLYLVPAENASQQVAASGLMALLLSLTVLIVSR